MTTAFREVQVDGLAIRYREAGQGPPLLHLQPGDAPDLTTAHELLARRFRVLVAATPTTPGPAAALPASLTGLVEGMGLEAFNLMGTGAMSAGALSLALQAPARVDALVLETPEALDAGLERRLVELAMPVLVLVGTRDDAATAVARTCRARLPNSHLVLVYDAGPAIASDRPAAFAEVVMDFLERRDAFVISAARTVISP